MEARVYDLDWSLPYLNWALYDCVDDIYWHMDCDGYYAGCAISENPKLWGLPIVVGGSVEDRHGIVLAKSQAAKKYGIKTGDPIWRAKQLCPNLIVVPVNFDLYKRMTDEHHAIASRYGIIQPYGPDEQWISVGRMKYSQAIRLARKLQKEIWDELGITASIGISYNKIMSKWASDRNKPNGLTVVRREDLHSMVWPTPVGDLFMVGPATTAKLAKMGIKTIGELARCDPSSISKTLHKPGLTVWAFANGHDFSKICDKPSPIKSIGNSATFPRDLTTSDDITAGLWTLAESVARRERLHGFRAQTVSLYIRDKDLRSFTRQMKAKRPTLLAHEIHGYAMELFLRHANLLNGVPIRSLGVRASNLLPEDGIVQLSFLPEEVKRQKTEDLERAIDDIRDRFGHFSIGRGSLMVDAIGEINPFDEHTIHPVPFM